LLLLKNVEFSMRRERYKMISPAVQRKIEAIAARFQRELDEKEYVQTCFIESAVDEEILNAPDPDMDREALKSYEHNIDFYRERIIDLLDYSRVCQVRSPALRIGVVFRNEPEAHLIEELRREWQENFVEVVEVRRRRGG